MRMLRGVLRNGLTLASFALLLCVLYLWWRTLIVTDYVYWVRPSTEVRVVNLGGGFTASWGWAPDEWPGEGFGSSRRPGVTHATNKTRRLEDEPRAASWGWFGAGGFALERSPTGASRGYLILPWWPVAVASAVAPALWVRRRQRRYADAPTTGGGDAG